MNNTWPGKSSKVRGADINIADNEGNTALIVAISRGHAKMSRTLITWGPAVGTAGYGGFTALTRSAIRPDLEIRQALITLGANLDIRSEYDGKSALMYACDQYHGNFGMVYLLVTAGADIRLADNKGRTALMYAVESGVFQIVSILLSAGADMNTADNRGSALWRWQSRTDRAK
jgi:ankyrin repeat protein